MQNRILTRTKRPLWGGAKQVLITHLTGSGLGARCRPHICSVGISIRTTRLAMFFCPGGVEYTAGQALALLIEPDEDGKWCQPAVCPLHRPSIQTCHCSYGPTYALQTQGNPLQEVTRCDDMGARPTR